MQSFDFNYIKTNTNCCIFKLIVVLLSLNSISMLKIGTRIKQLRELKDIPLKEVADKLEMTVQGYSRIERDEVDVSFSRLSQIADALNEKIESIISFDPKVFFNSVNNIQTVNGDFYSPLADNERKLYEDKIKLLEEIIRLKEAK